MALPVSICCFGALTVDRLTRCCEPPVLGASNPVQVRTASGGVAHNIARHLALFGHPVRLVSRVGDDADGHRLRTGLADHAIAADTVTLAPDQRTATYTAVLDPDGELVIGLADMAIYDALDAACLANQADRFSDAGLWVVDANLTADGLAWLTGHKGASRLIAAPVSPAKARRWIAVLDRVDIWIGNRIELGVTTGTDVATPADAPGALAALRARGPQSVVVTFGAAGAVVAEGAHLTWLRPPPATVVDVNGAGDSLLAGTAAALASGRSLTAAVAQGLALASLVIETPGPYRRDIDPTTLAGRLAAITRTPL